MALGNQVNLAVATESVKPSSILSGRYTGYDGGYLFAVSGGGTVRAEVLSTSEPIAGETYLLHRDSNSDRIVVKPRPRL